MEKVTITVEGTAEEVKIALERLLGAVPRGTGNVSWLAHEIDRFYQELQPEAQRILREIATNPAGYPRQQLIDTLGISGQGLAGRLSSVGHTLRRLFPAKPRPITLDDSNNRYGMLPEVAQRIAAMPAPNP